MRCLRHRQGQSVLELAIFGSLFLTLLAGIVSYGLRYNYQQKATMVAFRKALTATTTATDDHMGQGSYTLIVDKHVPNPSDPFGTGSTIPISASESVLKDGKTYLTYGRDDLPKSVVAINGQERIFNTSMITQISNASEAQVKRYKVVYGRQNVCSDEMCGAIRTCYQYGTDPYTGSEACNGYSSYTISIVDGTASQLMNEDMAKKTCRMLTDSAFCTAECQRGLAEGEEDKCAESCGVTVSVPWYCTGSNPGALFEFTDIEKLRTMGVGADRNSVTDIHNQLNQETGAETLSGGFTTTRTLRYLDTAQSVQNETISSYTGQ